MSETESVGPVARPWLDCYPSIVPKELSFPELAAWGLLERTALRHPHRIACRYYQQSLTYAEVCEKARRTASMLARFGMEPGDRVGVMLPNVPEYLWVLNGIWMAGGIAVALSPLMVPEEVTNFLKATNCKIVICLDVLAPLVVNSGALDHIFFATINDRLPAWQKIGYAFARWRRLGFWPKSDHPSQHSLEEQVERGDSSYTPITPQSLSAPAYILPTGGTTGDPKAVTLSHRNLVANAWQIYHWAGGFESREKMLCVLPFFHSYGLTTCLMSGVALAATLVMHHRFVPRVVLRLIEEHQPTFFPAVPAMLVALNSILRDRPISIRALRYVISGGAPLDVRVSEEFARFSGANVVEGYGMSEASPVICAGPLDGTDRAGSIGLPLPNTDVRIVDAETGTVDLPPGEVGELVVRGPQVMLGYWNNTQATNGVLRDGWLFTGDLGTRDADGFFRIVDRKKDLIITSGFNVYPADVEPILRQVPGIKDVAIVGVPDRATGEAVKAIVAVSDVAGFDRAAFDKHCEIHLSKHKRPKIVEVIEGDLPRNFLGKVLRRKLRTQSAVELQSQPSEESPS